MAKPRYIKAAKVRQGMIVEDPDGDGELIIAWVAIMGTKFYDNGTSWFEPYIVQVQVDGGAISWLPDKRLKVVGRWDR